ncbi:hypothetical protein ADH70_010580 [Blautia pseudococcoides]|uniref:Uncharacterized protein n=1 Tax=Blautia pseudococcoides TaxID=1796616 RepID=A0A1V0QF27_9FIRM|nr:hypothetical protein A4V09_24105 [Blautia pseudococcoides]ASU29255.1 hypothetical protein ADH70_010580 [Blautia pseudococcoides]
MNRFRDSIPHTFHYNGRKGEAGMLKYAGKSLKHIIVFDTWDYTKPFRYNVNPAPLYASGFPPAPFSLPP